VQQVVARSLQGSLPCSWHKPPSACSLQAYACSTVAGSALNPLPSHPSVHAGAGVVTATLRPLHHHWSMVFRINTILHEVDSCGDTRSLGLCALGRSCASIVIFVLPHRAASHTLLLRVPLTAAYRCRCRACMQRLPHLVPLLQAAGSTSVSPYTHSSTR
jgi:hypothetical protein